MKRATKEEYRQIFLSLQSDAKKYPGGISALAGVIGKSKEGLANSIDPNHESQPPSFSTVLQIIELTQENKTVFELCRLVGKLPIDINQGDEAAPCGSQTEKFLSLVETSSSCLNKASNFLKDGRIDASEKRMLAPMALSLLQEVASFYSMIKD